MELVTTPAHIVAFGECMVELSRTVIGGRAWQVAFGGDTYNVAAYLTRLGCAVGYMTALGTDCFSVEMREAFVAEGVGTAGVLTHPDRIAGLYAIRVDEKGEREFTCWRDRSAARAFFDCPGAEEALRLAEQADLLYLSGITLSLFESSGRARIEALAAGVRRGGGRVAFDTNFRPRGWQDIETARQAIAGFARHADIVLPTLADDRALFGDTDAAACARRWRDAGATEVAVKLGADGAFVSQGGEGLRVPTPEQVDARDTTGAGDSFNAAYLAARLAGHAPEIAAVCGNRLANVVVRHPGALIPRVVMPFRLIPPTAAVAS